MSHWNYRILDQGADMGLTLVEVYYEGDDNDIWAWSFASPPCGDDIEELKGDLVNMTQALGAPILIPEDLPDGRKVVEERWQVSLEPANDGVIYDAGPEDIDTEPQSDLGKAVGDFFASQGIESVQFGDDAPIPVADLGKDWAPDIVSKTLFGDVDYGPTAGIRVRVTHDNENPVEVAEAVWQYFTKTYQDPFQEYRLVEDDRTTVTVDIYTHWGSGRRSVLP